MIKALKLCVLTLAVAVPGARALGDPCTNASNLSNQVGNTSEPSERARLSTQLDEQTLLCREQQCQGGDAEACHDASLTLTNNGVYVQARVFEQKACDAGRKRSCDPHQAPKPTLAANNGILADAKDRCSKGDARNCEFAGNLLFRSGDPSSAEHFFTTSCNGGNGKGCANQAVCSARRADNAKATELLERGCRLGFSAACHGSPSALTTIW
jgi:hypothetical protein